MVTSQYDIVTVGGGLGGSALAKHQPENSARSSWRSGRSDESRAVPGL